MKIRKIKPVIALVIGLLVTNVSASTKLDDSELGELTVTKAAHLIRSGMISSERLVQVLIEKATRNGHLNAFITLDIDAALASAKAADMAVARGEKLGPLHGVPIVVKDNIDVQGMANTAGTPALKNHYPKADAPVVAALKTAGALVIGKTNMHELAFGITSDNAAFGAVRNPYNPLTFAGGSSGGTAVAVAARMAPAGLGTDTGGSARIPPALNGVVGFRPTVGRYSGEGITPISTTRDTAGPVARSVTDIVLLDQVMSGSQYQLPEVDLSKLRLGVPRGYFYNNLDPAVAQRMDAVLSQLKDSGVELIEADLDGVAELNQKVGFPLAIYEVLRALPEYLSGTEEKVDLQGVINQIASPDVKFVLGKLAVGDDGIVGTADDAVSEEVYREALNTHRPALQNLYRDYFKQHKVDGIIFPTTILPARQIEGSIESVPLNGKMVQTFGTYIHNTDPGSNVGIPGLTIPAGLSPEGLPIGVEIDGPEQSDVKLLAIGAALEQVLGGIAPPVLP